MAEAEDVIVDTARHAAIFTHRLWRRYRPPAEKNWLGLADVGQRLHLLITAVFGGPVPIRVAQAMPPAGLLWQLAHRNDGPVARSALPATDGHCIWLPRQLDLPGAGPALDCYRLLALQQAMRARRGSPLYIGTKTPAAVRDLFLLLEAAAADLELAQRLPALVAPLDAARGRALAQRPPLDAFPGWRRPLELLARELLAAPCQQPPAFIQLNAHPGVNLARAAALASTLALDCRKELRGGFLFKDWWSGEFHYGQVAASGIAEDADASGNQAAGSAPPRSVRLERRPEIRQPQADEDAARQGAWMVQTAQPHEHAEDPIGIQRPTDRDEKTAAEEFADSLSGLPEARLVTTPTQPLEVLLADDAPGSHAKKPRPAASAIGGIRYPEWDYRIRAYRPGGATVRLSLAPPGPQLWVAATLQQHRAMLAAIRRRFEMLHAHRVRCRQQLDGDEVDLEAYIDGYAGFCAGQAMPQALYQTQRPARRDMAISLLVDVSGSTDGWIAAQRRVIDVEREALLLVCVALDGMAQPYAVSAFSGEGPGNVTLRTVKDFGEAYGEQIAGRIAGLEPEHYTRAGAAIRHASAMLARQPARHRLLLLLSDGKPNDVDQYEGRYGLEDMRQAVLEARRQGISLFCLTIDRQAAAYLPQVFGARRYALLPKPELLPTVLLDWMKRLLAA